jgi:hypothetical protein
MGGSIYSFVLDILRHPCGFFFGGYTSWLSSTATAFALDVGLFQNPLCALAIMPMPNTLVVLSTRQALGGLCSRTHAGLMEKQLELIGINQWLKDFLSIR